MANVSRGLVSKSDQLNAMDLIDPLAIQIDRVDFDHTRKQPIWIYYNKLKNPWKPSLGMNKIIASNAVFGIDDDFWVGKRLRIFNEPTVKYAGEEKGGVEIREVDGFDKIKTFLVKVSRHKNKFVKISPLILSEKEITFFENLYGAGDENINSTNSTVNVKVEPETPLYLDATQIDIIQSLLDTAKWDIADFCGVMDVGALSEIGAVKFDNLRTKLNDKIATQYKENT